MRPFLPIGGSPAVTEYVHVLSDYIFRSSRILVLLTYTLSIMTPMLYLKCKLYCVLRLKMLPECGTRLVKHLHFFV